MESGSRSMNLTLISVRDLNNTNILSQTKAYAVAWISNDLRNKQRKRLGKDNVMKFTLDESALQQGRLVLQIVIYADATLGDKEIGRVSDKEIGRVSVKLKEFLRSAGGNKGADYTVRNPSGKAKGVLNLSVRLDAMPEVKQEFLRSAGGNKGADDAVRKPSGKAKGVLNPSVNLAAKPEVKLDAMPEVKQEFLRSAGGNKGASTGGNKGASTGGNKGADYAFRKPSGKAKGVLNPSVNLAAKPEVKQQQQQPQAVAGLYGWGKENAEPVTAYPAYPQPSSSSQPPRYPPPNNQYPPPQYPPQAGYPPPPPHYQGYPPPPPHYHGYPPPPPPPHYHGYPPPLYQGYPPNQGYPPYQWHPPVVPAAQQPPRNNYRPGMDLEGLVLRTLAEWWLENNVGGPYDGGFDGGNFGGDGFDGGNFGGDGFDGGF